MKKKKLVVLVSGVLVGVVGAALFIVSTAGVPKKETNWESLRGTESYYTGDEQEIPLPDYMGNLKGSQSQHFVKLALTAVYRVGPELKAGPAFFEAKKAAITDRLHLLFASKTVEDLDGAERKQLIREEIRSQLQMLLFPDKKGRIEKILFRDIFVN